MAELQGRRALITGGASGIGHLAAETFAREGDEVFVFDADGESAADLAGRIQAQGGRAAWVAGSVAEEEDVRAAFELLDRELGGIDILFNNAGISDNKPTLEMTAADWDRTMDINLRGAFLCAQEAGRRMCAQGSGAIVNNASIWGLAAAPERMAYTVSKTGLVAMTKVLANEWAARGVRVNAVCPGFTNTPMIQSLVERGKLDPTNLTKRTPMGRMAHTEEIVDLVLFLASDRASFITGQAIAADGGWTSYAFLQDWLDAR